MATTIEHARPMSRELYYALYAESGKRVELIEGEVFAMSPAGGAHTLTVEHVHHLLAEQLDSSLHVREEKPLSLTGTLPSDPQPDLAVVRGPYSRYGTKERPHPDAHDVFLIVEVADNSLTRDRDEKVPLYAKHGVPEYWIVDLNNRRVLVYRDPHEGAYYDITERKDGTVTTLNATIAVDDLLIAAHD